MTYEEAVAYIEEIPKFTQKTTLDHTARLLARLGNPERGMKIIHVAGTNGKGSVCAFLNSMLMEGGFRTGLFTSPHLVRTNERFQINSLPVEDDVFTEALEEVLEAVRQTTAEGDSHPTYFETLFLMGMLIFRREKTDYVVVEVGMGGRLDATNVLDSPLASIITSISLDHTEYLGDSLQAIAGEKAGIIKRGIPVIYDGSRREVASVLADRAREAGSRGCCLRPDMVRLLDRDRRGIRFLFSMDKEEPIELGIPYIAEYQMMNAALAFYTMLCLRQIHGIALEALCRGLEKTSWPGRMETILDGVVVDGAHNADGVAQFVRTAAHFHRDGEITILFSAVSDKDYSEMIREIAEKIRPERVITTSVGGYREVDAESLAACFRQAGCPDVTACQDTERALDMALEAKREGMLFCVGSLYLVGQIKSILAEVRRRTL